MAAMATMAAMGTMAGGAADKYREPIRRAISAATRKATIGIVDPTVGMADTETVQSSAYLCRTN
jgi:hypothetical protein